MKSFEQQYSKVYNRERHNFHSLRDHEGMIKYLGDFTHKEALPSLATGKAKVVPELEPTLKTTYNILLEYAEYDLEEVFAHRLPPVFPPEIDGFWASLFEVANAVRAMHDLKAQDGRQYHG
jgi:hypothetical protein